MSDRGRTNDLYVKAADGSSRAEPLLDSLRQDLPVWEVSYSPDGDWILYRVESESSDLFAVPTTGDGGPITVLATDRLERMPALSPNGRWITYISNMSGQTEVYVRPFPDTQAWMRQISTAGGSEPRWARSGRELFYRNGQGDLVAVPVAGGDAFGVGEEQVLFPTDDFLTAGNRHQYDVAPGDQRFLMLRRVAGATSIETIVVENFFQELEAATGR